MKTDSHQSCFFLDRIRRSLTGCGIFRSLSHIILCIYAFLCISGVRQLFLAIFFAFIFSSLGISGCLKGILPVFICQLIRLTLHI